MSTKWNQSKLEAAVAKAMYATLRRSHGARHVERGQEERHAFDNVMVNAQATGLNLRVLARAAIREQRRQTWR